MLITSRSYAEYLAMFGLDDEDLDGGVVDVSAGGSSFVAGCWERGLPALAVDPVYDQPHSELAVYGRDAIDAGHAIIADHPDRFVWDYYENLEERRAVRAESASHFLADIQANPQRYVAGELPHLPLRTGAVRLALCSHLLFTWSDLLDEAWHLAAVRELLRVAGQEVRLFPLVTAGSGDAVPYLDNLVATLEREDGVRCHRQRVGYEFQRGGNTTLVIERAT